MSAEAASDALWALLAAALLGGVALSHRRAGRLARLSSLLRWLAAHPPLHVALLVGWAWLGWHLFAR